MRFGLEIFLAVLGAALLGFLALWLAFRGQASEPPSDALWIGSALTVILVAAATGWWLTRSHGRRLGELEALGRRLLRSEGQVEPPGSPKGSYDGLARLLTRFAEGADERVAQIEAESQQLKAAVGGMSEGVMVTDSDGRVAFANPQWRQLFGLTGEIEGASVLELSRQTALDRMLATTLATNRSQQIELEVSKPPTGSPRTLILNSAPLSEAGGAVVVAQDVTAFLRLTEIRRDFVANVSHELKTPLSAIRGFAETLAHGAKDDPKASKRFLKRILKQCSRLDALLSDLLTLSRLEHAADRGRKTPIDLSEIVHEIVEEMGEQVARKNLTLVIDARTVPPIEGDAVALERLCINLLENAVKYNRSEGEIRVRLFESDGSVVLEVEDTGIGIPAASLDRLFERFYRVDKGRSREEGGTGLGLAIVKHAASLHGGGVEVESDLGRGSLFRVRLPSTPGTYDLDDPGT